MNVNNRVFCGKSSSANGEVSASTRFHCYQDADRIWADYAGGEITSGHLQGKMLSDGSLEFVCHHQDIHGELMAGKCRSTLHQNPDGALVLKENRQWFTGDQTTGTSELEEVVEP
ncbi:hypothetical protein [Alcanivorax quisquiliarum]|uniref:N-acetylglutamate synthase n=1 Tax=Alcanivorax quisquiliarum TaxID=2933565 RepID=A0ABT0E602_9GAMM|nr:hypothetical protein [Alcanivorax quisquiliarum]MCK0537072.1 hypothetical protein [Alcanivorax quisquiliarum]